MHSIFTVAVVVATVAAARVDAQNAYNSILAEAQQWQQQNPNACGHDISTCGVAKMVENFQACSAFRVVNGCPVEKPLTVGWQAALLMGGGLCSGVLVTPQIVLTASHCLHEIQSASQIKVFLGTNTIKGRTGQQFGASSFGVNPNFNSDTVANDVAFVKLDRPAQMDEVNGIRTACLPVAGTTAPKNKLCMVSGFGTNEPRGGGAGELRYTLLQKQEDRGCQVYGSYNPAVSFCALGQRGSKGTDTCQGDSGSSLMCKDESGRWVSTGVVSYGASNCGQVPGVYADVAKLGITVPSRASVQEKCKTAADSQPLPSAPTKPTTGAAPANGPKKPTYSGTSTSISASVAAHGCESDSECQSNICRSVALCTGKNNNFGGLFGSGNGGGMFGGSAAFPGGTTGRPTFGSGIFDGKPGTHTHSGSGKLPGGGTFHYSSQVSVVNSRSKKGESSVYNVTTVQDLLNKPISKLADRRSRGQSQADGFRQILNSIRGNVGMLFARRNCQIHSVCSAERHQQQHQQQGMSPMLVAMFEDDN